MNGHENGIGFLAGDGGLFCSRECAARHGATIGYDVDQDEYEALVECDAVAAGALCPGCGAEFEIPWEEEPPN